MDFHKVLKWFFFKITRNYHNVGFSFGLLLCFFLAGGQGSINGMEAGLLIIEYNTTEFIKDKITFFPLK